MWVNDYCNIETIQKQKFNLVKKIQNIQPPRKFDHGEETKYNEKIWNFRHTTLSGTPGGGKERFLGGGPRRYDLLSKRHSPIFPYVRSP